jgi:hypothetical protein
MRVAAAHTKKTSSSSTAGFNTNINYFSPCAFAGRVDPWEAGMKTSAFSSDLLAK